MFVNLNGTMINVNDITRYYEDTRPDDAWYPDIEGHTFVTTDGRKHFVEKTLSQDIISKITI